MRDLLSPWGELRPQAASDWQGEVALPVIVASLYEQIGPWGEIVHEKVGPTGLSLNAGGKPDFQLFAPDLLTAFAAIACVANTMRELDEQAFDDTYELTAAARAQVTLDLDELLAGSADARQMLAAWRWYC
ncbi:hypothetical protein UNDKW_5620 [Undibacterium sp. KW1]|uniref:hypothetical protein n=1 Tax=Undibacterium sp. KW1 TaxID=2058624 RepID=UPI001331C9F7|nr:hypothetical protein [Undibacterium sp. KW1]BBB63893.1 hypothetical protein UNDKW_5620 [Undibacterium sp. KW1]